MGKGSKRRIEDFSKIAANWDDIDWTPKTKKTSEDWMKQLCVNVTVIDFDGWNDVSPEFFAKEPITEADFWDRLHRCTIVGAVR